ncbi:MAG TPA: sulfotransferase, partial [Sphingomicrobium sp.]|nr:sulfotransferase [Sphingomicrobium sp.]
EDRLSFLWALHRYRQGQIGEARELLLKSSPERDPKGWHRLRANIADREGDSTTAFAASVEVNRLTDGMDAWRERAREFRRGLRDLAERVAYDKSLNDIAAPSPPGPAFIVGFPRSGTTLLDTFLMGHSSIVVLEEKEIFRQATKRLGIDLPSTHRLPALESARSEYLRLLAQQTDQNAGTLVIDKDPLNMLAPHLIRALFPHSPIIFVQRHPCDVVLSCFMQSFTPNLGMANFLDLSDAVDFYDSAMAVWTAATANLPLNVRTVVYEDLVQDPEGQLRPVVEFLGLDWEDGLLDHRSTAAARGAIMNTSYNQVTERLTGAAVGRWRRYEKQLEDVLPKLLPWAERLGYR